MNGRYHHEHHKKSGSPDPIGPVCGRNSGGVDQVFAADPFPTEDATVSNDINYETSSTVKGKIQGNGSEKISVTNKSPYGYYEKDGKKDDKNEYYLRGVVGTTNTDSVSFSKLSSLDVSDKGHSTIEDVLYSGGGALSITDVKDVTLTKTGGDVGGQVIHAYAGQISIENIDNLTVTSQRQGLMVQKQSNNNGIDIDVKNDVNIHTKGNAVMAGVLNDNSGSAGISIKAGGKVSIISDTGAALHSFNTSGEWGNTGNTSFTIAGKNGVEIHADNSVAISVVRGDVKDKAGNVTKSDTGSSKINISSDDGDVSISGGNAVNLGTTGGASVSGTITGKKVDLTSTKTSVALNNAALTLNGESTITSANNQAVNIKGKAGELIIGDDSHTNSTAKINGDVIVDVKERDASKAFISGKGTVTFSEDSKLHILNADTTGNTSYKLSDVKVTGDNNIFDASADGIYGGNWLINPKVENGSVTFTKGLKDSVRGLTVLDNVLDAAGKDPDSKVGNFFGDITSNTDDTVNAANVNSVANLGELAGLNHGTYTASRLFTDTVGNHLSTLPQDKDLWGYYVHSKESVDGLGLAGVAANYDTTYDGAVVGMDLYQKENTAAGVAVSYINGSLEGAGVKNDADYYGLSFYGRKDLANFSLVGDVSYLHGSNTITQTVAGKTFTAKPDVDAFTVGVKALKDVALTDNSKLTPYVGARYLRINTEKYSASNGLTYDADSQDLLIVPVGVDYSADFKHGAWTYRPTVGVGYVWNAAGRSVDQTVSLGDTADSFSYNTVDSSSFIAHVGVTAEKESLSFGVGYEYQDGSSTSADKWYVNAAYRF